jgi:hypothetical protein
VVLTDLARERCDRYAIRLIRTKRAGAHPEDAPEAELAHRVKAAVIARLGEGVDATVLDAAVKRAMGESK